MKICAYKHCNEEVIGRKDKIYCSKQCGIGASIIKNRKLYKERAIAVKGGACEKCGYNKSQRALTFHHLDPSKKDFTISHSNQVSWKKIEKELDKCIMLCANCHAEEHDTALNSLED